MNKFRRLRLLRISAAPFAVTLAVLYFLLGFGWWTLGILPALTGAKYDVATAITTPFLMAVGGAVSGFLIAWTYNATAQITKGVVLEIEETDIDPL